MTEAESDSLAMLGATGARGADAMALFTTGGGLRLLVAVRLRAVGATDVAPGGRRRTAGVPMPILSPGRGGRP